MSEDEIKAWFFKYGQYANGRDMALVKAIEAAIKPQRTWVGLSMEQFIYFTHYVKAEDLMEIEQALMDNNT